MRNEACLPTIAVIANQFFMDSGYYEATITEIMWREKNLAGNEKKKNAQCTKTTNNKCEWIRIRGPGVKFCIWVQGSTASPLGTAGVAWRNTHGTCFSIYLQPVEWFRWKLQAKRREITPSLFEIRIQDENQVETRSILDITLLAISSLRWYYVKYIYVGKLYYVSEMVNVVSIYMELSECDLNRSQRTY